jgi:hypothetical protein
MRGATMAVWGEVSLKVKRAMTLMEDFTVGQLADMTGLEYQSVETVVQRLLRGGFVVESEPRHKGGQKRVGRPRKVYSLIDDPAMLKQLHSGIEALRFEDAVRTAPDRRPSSAHFDAAVAIINSIEAGEEEANRASLEKGATLLAFAKRHEEMLEEGIEISHAYVSFQQARIEFLRGNKESARQFLTAAKATFAENELHEQVRIADDYEAAMMLRTLTSSALKDAEASRFGLALKQFNAVLDCLPSLALSPALKGIIGDLARMTSLATESRRSIAEHNLTLAQTNEKLLAENARLRLRQQDTGRQAEWLFRPSERTGIAIPSQGFSLPTLRESVDELLLLNAGDDVPALQA